MLEEKLKPFVSYWERTKQTYITRKHFVYHRFMSTASLEVTTKNKAEPVDISCIDDALNFIPS